MHCDDYLLYANWTSSMKSGRSGVIEGVQFALNRFKKYIASPVPAHQVITAMNTTFLWHFKIIKTGLKCMHNISVKNSNCKDTH